MTTERIVYTRPDGGVSVVVPSPEWTGTMAELQAKVVPNDATLTEIVPVADVPSDRRLRNAWKQGEQGAKVGVDMVKGKDIVHELRRAAREVEFKPHDDIIAKQIPGADAVAAEAARAAIRTKYDQMQTDVDAATVPTDLITIIETNNLSQ
jgi:hypothetical protein